MATKQCPNCESRGGLNFMKGDVIQPYDGPANQPEIINWTCPFCGFTDTDESYMTDKAGMYNTKS